MRMESGSFRCRLCAISVNGMTRDGFAVRCGKCETKQYCVPCMTTWYPNMSE
ncbi:hypothetical protein HanRHA438_Chr10g0445351 [Helianthus annuus]|uniref:Uncharacterized protein n=1 Tax=Helianthus annuus TaxID=4232 RepID=A0A251TM01_HELAN|nr:hypothetical protein HanHA300_Chr10g0355981 [Helianthus annuus]KAJ0521090.1 hypothetical protein HanIR_Chr10g0466851 [Helianthus annuus]KAJ0529411.1 hypothetical protein HanHA89_Chr10g0377561 [Helianthus annuus]KAJ0696297.1 hypothetical protein HanLR1_Chr10g0355461 [Helianthus annuus]KAJ0699737.1 hypothetical protein HanOQP8_Chr10g0359421 [Helianthus annuus]